MPHIALPGETRGVYSIAGITFVDGVADPDSITETQRIVLAYVGGEVDGSVPDLPEPPQSAQDQGIAPDDPDRFPRPTSGAAVEGADLSAPEPADPNTLADLHPEAAQAAPVQQDQQQPQPEQQTAQPPAEQAPVEQPAQPEAPQPTTAASDQSGAEVTDASTPETDEPAAGI